MDEATRLIASATRKDGRQRAVSPPIERATTVLMPSAARLFDDSEGSTYGISGLQAHHALAAGLAELEHAAFVALAPTGLAAITVPLLSALRAGDEVLVTDAAYGPTRRFCDRFLKRYGVTARYYPPRAGADEIMTLAQERTRLIVLESPGTITLEMQDIPAITAAARSRGIRTLVDNTWAAGLLFKPLDHGVDYSVQALSKYVGGHSDVFGGSVAVADKTLARELQTTIDDMGWYISPDDCWLLLRGLRTLPVRLAQHDRSGREVAAWLALHPAVREVLHPALPASPDHAIWARDFSGACGLFSMVLNGGHEQVLAFCDALQLFGMGVSWGGFESLAIPCRDQLARRLDRSEAAASTVRLHVGLESPDDLIADLEQALAAVFPAAGR